jgi:hypothetical protein
MDMTTGSKTPQSYCLDIAAFLRGRPGFWTQGTNARDEGGRQVDPRSPFATRWCAAGLLQKFISDEHTRDAARLLLVRTVTRPGYPPMSIETYNDQQTSVEPVIQMFEAAAHLPELTPPRPTRTWHGFVNDGFVPEPFGGQKVDIPDWLKVGAPQWQIPNWGKLATPTPEEAMRVRAAEFAT